MAACVIAATWVFYCSSASVQCGLKLQYLQYLAGAQTFWKYYAILIIHCQLQIKYN